MTHGTIEDLRTAARHLRRCAWDDPADQAELEELASRVETLAAREASRCVRKLAEC